MVPLTADGSVGTRPCRDGARRHRERSCRGAFRYQLAVQYVGTHFSGWQIQPGRRTVQGELYRCLRSAFKLTSPPRGCGRTDAGVHAECQVVDCDLPVRLPPQKVMAVINRILPVDIGISRCFLTSPDFDARRDARRRTYEYRVRVDDNPTPFCKDRFYYIPRRLDPERLNRAARGFIGAHDFAAYSVTGTETATTVRTVSECRWFEREGTLVFRISADAFLRKMVRMITAAMFMNYRRRLTLREINTMLTTGKRIKNIAPVPPSGLYLTHVEY